MLKDEVLTNGMSSSLGCTYSGNRPCGRARSDVGLDGTLTFTSLAWKNLGAFSGLVTLVDELLRSIRTGLQDTDEPGPSLFMLPVRDLRPVFATRRPSPLVVRASVAVSRFSIDGTGLGLSGVPLGVPFGVGDVVSALAFLDPDLGVMFELKKGLAGVATQSSAKLSSAPAPSDMPSLRRAEYPFVVGVPASFGRELTLPAHLGDSVLMFGTGRRLGMPFCRLS